MDYLSIFETYRCFVRAYTPGDLELAKQLMQNEAVMRYSNDGPLLDEEVFGFLHQRINDEREKGYSLWAAFELKGVSHYLGFSGLSEQIVEGETFVEIGYRLLPAYWGKGYGTELTLAVMEWGFRNQDLNLPHLSAIIDQKNQASIKVAKNLGMQIYKEDVVLFDHHSNIYRITRKEWGEGEAV